MTWVSQGCSSGTPVRQLAVSHHSTRSGCELCSRHVRRSSVTWASQLCSSDTPVKRLAVSHHSIKVWV